jgi:hypothetical protein
MFSRSRSISLRVQLALPPAVIDRDAFGERQFQEVGDIGRHRDDGDHGRAAVLEDGRSRLACGADGVEDIGASQRRVGVVRHGAETIAVTREQRNGRTDPGDWKSARDRSAREAGNGGVASHAERDRD